MPYVSVYVDPSDTMDGLDDDVLEAELERRREKREGKKPRKPQPLTIEAEEVAAIADRLKIGRIDEALILLERVLPSDFRHLSEDVQRFYAGARVLQ